MSERMYPGIGPDERTSFAAYSAFDIPEDLRELHGRYDVVAVAKRVRNFRYAEEWMMMMMGGWIATVPEVPVKTGLGKVIWEAALAADEFGKRLPELRCGRRATESGEPANQGFADFIQSLAEPETPDLTIEKLAGVFDVDSLHRERALFDRRFSMPFNVVTLSSTVIRTIIHTNIFSFVCFSICFLLMFIFLVSYYLQLISK